MAETKEKHVCVECGKWLRRLDTNVCDECLERILKDLENGDNQRKSK